MTSFVLVHGGWAGGWCWQRVASRLRAQQADVFTPTLTGLGERAHLSGFDLTLDTHIEDVAAVIRFYDLDDVVLVGHSYGGMVVTGVADRLAERIRRIVYLDAVVPEDGRSFFDLLGPEYAGAVRAMADERGLADPPMAQFLGVTEPEDVAWVESHLTPHPVCTAEDPIALRNPDLAAVPRTYILCPGGVMGPFYRAAKAAGWPTMKLGPGHAPMVTAPDAVAEALLDAARA